MAAAYLQLLGTVQVRIGSTSVPFRATHADQLLAYLAYRADWVSREQLHYLFWSEQNSEAAQRNLRRLLMRVRKPSWLKGLETYRQLLRWQVESDVATFREALQAGRWEQALSLYQGPLLDGLEGNTLSEFTTWLALERERLHQDWRIALLKRAEDLQREGLPFDAARLLTTLLESEELDEEALKAYMRAALQAGGREQALKAYEGFSKRLRDELDLTPTAELEQLAQQVRSGDSRAFTPSAPAQPVPSLAVSKGDSLPPATSLPTIAASFVGRDLELSEAAELMANPECRLLTLTGVGGVGKTRLALKAVTQLAATYQDGVHFVGLEALSTPTLIPSTIADALRVRLHPQGEPLEQIIRFIGTKQLLLVLDNYEHLLGGAALASELLQACPNLDLLVTSRERLDVEEEWLLPIEGLAYPKDEDLEEGQYFDAVQLFWQRAKRVRPDFVLNQENLPPVLTICGLIEGSPLGLELAAAWVRLMPLRDIAQAISENLDFLTSSSRRKNERHQSLRAAFEYSWKLLTLNEQAALRKLSVFRGGFTKEAAKQVADASLPILAALLDKSVLRVSGGGRYDCHALVYQYSREKLAEHPHERAQTAEKHGLYYLRFVQEQAGIFHTAKRKAARQIIGEDLDNIRSAWEWAVAETRLDIIKRSAFALSDFFEGRRHDGLETFARTAAALNETNPEHRAALGYVLLGQVNQQRGLGFSPQKTKVLSERAIALLEPLKDDQGLARGLWELADDEGAVGNFSRAQALLVDALALAQRAGEPRLIGHILCLLALLIRETSPFEGAKQFMEKASSELAELGSTNHQAYLLLIYGAYLVYEDHVAEGEVRLKESLRLSAALGGGQDFRTYILIDLARAAHKRAAFGEAEGLLREAQREAEQRHHKESEATALFLLGRSKGAQGAFAEARAYLVESLRIAWQEQHWLVLSAALVYLAELEAARGQPARAVELLTLVQGQEALEKRDRGEARRLLDKLRSQLPPDELSAAEARGKALILNEVIPALLA